MSKMKKSLCLVTALALGATMLSSVDNAWGMMDSLEDQRSGSGSRSYSGYSSVPGLAGDVLVTDELRLGAVAVLESLELAGDAKTIQSTPGLLDHLLNLKNYGIERVMTLVRFSHGSKINTHDCIKEALLMIRDAQADPYFEVFAGRIIVTPSIDGIADEKIGAIKNKASVEKLFEDEFPLLNMKHSSLKDSFWARLPGRDQEQVEQIYSKVFENHFELLPKKPDPIVRKRGEKTKQWQLRQATLRKKEGEYQSKLQVQKKAADMAFLSKLTEAKSMYATLMQLEEMIKAEELAVLHASIPIVSSSLGDVSGDGSLEPSPNPTPIPVTVSEVSELDPLTGTSVGSAITNSVAIQEEEEDEPLDLSSSFSSSSSSSSSSPMTYEEYFRDFLPQMGDSCRAYNGFQETDEEILAILFPGLQPGTYPDRERATKKFAELAAGGRPYAKLFNPPSFPSSLPMTYEEYFRDFLPQMGDLCRAYNGFQKTNEEILAILFSGLQPGTYPDRERATKKFAELAAGGRSYAKLFNPPSDL